MKEQVKEIIESINAEFLQRGIGEFSRRIRNCIVARGGLYERLNQQKKFQLQLVK